MIEYKNVSFSYNHFNGNEISLIRDLSMTIGTGEFVSLIGPNGSGKSTLAMLANGALTPSEGGVLVDGINSSDSRFNSERRRTVGVLLQNPADNLIGSSVETELAFGLENYGYERSEMKKRVDRYLNLLNLAEMRKMHPRNLSGGEQQLLALAGIMILEPDYLICDEVTTFLDYPSRQEVLRILRDYVSNGHGVFLITQFPIEVIDTDRLIVLSSGRIIADGEPKLLLKDQELMHTAGHRVPVEFIMQDKLSSLIETIS